MLMLAMALPSCKTTGFSEKIDVTRVACGSFSPIFWSKKDTPETVSQVKEHNAAGTALCGWGGK